jgi:hypothetical protein
MAIGMPVTNAIVETNIFMVVLACWGGGMTLSRRVMRYQWLVPVFAGAVVVLPSSALAWQEDPPSNTLTVQSSPARFGYTGVPRSDGFFDESAAVMDVSVSYARALVHGFALGLGAEYMKPYTNGLHVLGPFVLLRGYWTLSDGDIDLGLTARGSGSFAWIPLMGETLNYSGYGASIAIDMHYWMSPAVALKAAMSVSVFVGEPSDSVQSGYFRDETLLVGTLGPSVGLVYRF